MKNLIKKTIQISIPLLFGVFLIWWVVKDLTPKEINEAKNAFYQANYFYLLLSMCIGFISHIIRAIRWEYMIQSMGYTSRFSVRYHSIMINYVLNLFVPRMGEVVRCTTLSRYEKIPFNKAVGTLILERMIDFLLLSIMIVLVIFLEKDKVWQMVESNLSSKIPTSNMFLILTIILLGISIFGYYFIRESKIAFIKKTKDFLVGVKEGLTSIIHIKNQFNFWIQSILIWLFYLLGTYVCFLSLPQTQNVPVSGVVSCFVLGGIASIATQGGLGAYPIAFGTILKLYGVSYVLGWTFGWISWISNNLVILILGIISLLFITRIKRKIVK